MLKRYAVSCSLIVAGILTLQCSSGNSETSSPDNQRTRPKRTAGGERGAQTVQDVLVETTFLTARSINSFIVLSSTTETESMVDVYPQVPGIITGLSVEEGDRIAKDDILVQLDDREFLIAEETARVNFLKSESVFIRTNESFEKNIISKLEFDNAKFTMQEIELQWKQAQLNLSYSRVTAPISGIVTQRNVRSGDRVQTSTILFQIVDTSDKIARVFIPENEINRIKIRQKAIIVSEFLDGREFPGYVKRMSPIVDPASGTFKITVGIDDPENTLRPGMFITVRIITAVHENVIAVPKDAIVYDNGLPYVFKVEASLANRIPLKAGFSDDLFIESLDNFSAGDEIIVVGQNGLKDGARIRTLPLNNEHNGRQ